MAQPVRVSVVVVALEAAQLDLVLNRRYSNRQLGRKLQTNLLLNVWSLAIEATTR